ncbi:XRE family transcriptional regulator [Weissella ceti]|uniref:XRE family transcriptional regulator n=1 Tax=Weissella ceti TaxID=759620 RepID=A0ABT3E4E3_9LACO|nr:XRE family transcriptional regulator [Weissella ceti]MCW0953230.1 XRE family transcriptional regulator [Weissella ceti]QVK12746.1 XRE family transcriptional regulator [Weissella ceti]
MSTFERVKEISEKHGYSSLRTLAETAGLGTNAIYNWKKSEPTTKSAKAVADVLGVSVDYLLGNTDNPTASHSDQEPVDLQKVVDNEDWDKWLSSGGRPLTDHDKKLLMAMFGSE